MKNVSIKLLYVWICFGLFFSKEINAQWAKTFGGASNDIAYSVQQTTDGGYIIAGKTSSFGSGSEDVLLIKTDASGNIQWIRTFGEANYSEGASSVEQTSDGGYIIAGYRGGDILLIKTDAIGNVQWAKTFDGGSYDEYATSVQQTSDGGYIIAGYTYQYGYYYDFLLIKTDASGNLQWSRIMGGANSDIAHSVRQTTDGGYIIVGNTLSFGVENLEVLLIKMNANGNFQWAKTLGGTGSDWVYSVQQTTGGGYILAGGTYSLNTGLDVLLISTYGNGVLQWVKTFGGVSSDFGYSVRQTSDGGYIIAGYTYSFGAGGKDVLLIKTDASGNIQWAKTFGGADDDEAYSVQQTTDGGYIIAGITKSFGAGGFDVLLIKTDANGNSCFGSNTNLNVINPPFGTALAFPSTTIISASANVNPAVSSPSVTANTICSSSVNENLCSDIKIEHFSFKNNKISLKFSGYKEGEIKIVIYDISGKEKFSRSLNLKPYIEIEDKKIEKLKSGIYFLKVYLGNREIGGFKLIKK